MYNVSKIWALFNQRSLNGDLLLSCYTTVGNNLILITYLKENYMYQMLILSFVVFFNVFKAILFYLPW